MINYIILGVLVILIILVIILIFKVKDRDTDNLDMLERLNRFEVNINKELNDNFIKMNENMGEVIKSEEPITEQKKFVIDDYCKIPFENLVQTVSNIPIKMEIEEENAFPEEYSFLDMFNAKNIEELDIKNRWKNNDSITSIATPIGINELGKLIKLDIHEKYHGPHGLIAGSTGSRKIRIYNYIHTFISTKLPSK